MNRFHEQWLGSFVSAYTAAYVEPDPDPEITAHLSEEEVKILEQIMDAEDKQTGNAPAPWRTSVSFLTMNVDLAQREPMVPISIEEALKRGRPKLADPRRALSTSIPLLQMRTTSTHPINTRKTDAVMSSLWAELQVAMQTSQIVTVSQFVRINTSLINGDAMSRVLAADGPKYAAGLYGSFSSILSKAFKYIISHIPLLGSETTLSIANAIVNIADPTVYNVNVIRTGVFRFPFRVGYPADADGAIYARAIDMNTFTQIRAGTAVAVAVPSQWSMDKWGDSVAIIPVSIDMQNQPEALAAWTSLFMQYPYAMFGPKVKVKTSVGDAATPDIYAVSAASCNFMPGVVKRVLYVLANAFPQSNQNVTLKLGTPTSMVDIRLADNGFTGTDITITAQMDTFFSDAYPPSRRITRFWQCVQWWHKYFGNDEDYVSALIDATDTSYMLSPLPAKATVGGLCRVVVNDPDSVAYDLSPGYDAADARNYWNFATSSSTPISLWLDGRVAGVNVPWDFIAANTVKSIGARTIGMLNPIAAVDAVWGLLTFVNSKYTMPADAFSLASRSRVLAQSMTNMVDYCFKATGYPMNELTCGTVIQNFSGGMHIVNVIQKVYEKISNMLQPDGMADKSMLKLTPHNLYTWNQWNVWDYMQLNLDISVPDSTFASYARVPTTSLVATGIELPLPNTFTISKMNCDYDLRAMPDGLYFEWTSYATVDPYSESARSWLELMSTQYYVTADGGINPNLSPVITLTARAGQVEHGMVLPFAVPDLAIALRNTYDATYFPIPTNYLFIVDPVVLPAMVTRSAVKNRTYTLCFRATSPFLATITRTPLKFYNMRIHDPTPDTISTALLTNGDVTSSDNIIDNLLGF